jgi:hypothetical protein
MVDVVVNLINAAVSMAIFIMNLVVIPLVLSAIVYIVFNMITGNQLIASIMSGVSFVLYTNLVSNKGEE